MPFDFFMYLVLTEFKRRNDFNQPMESSNIIMIPLASRNWARLPRNTEGGGEGDPWCRLTKKGPRQMYIHNRNRSISYKITFRLYKSDYYFMKSVYSIQKTPSLLPWAISSWRRCCGHSVHSSDQLPFQEKRPHGLRSRNNLEQRQRGRQ